MIKQTFLSFQKTNEQTIYEIAIKFFKEKFIVTTSQDVLKDGLPFQSRTQIPPYSKREEKTLEKANLYHDAYVLNLKKTHRQNGWQLLSERIKNMPTIDETLC